MTMNPTRCRAETSADWVERGRCRLSGFTAMAYPLRVKHTVQLIDMACMHEVLTKSWRICQVF